MIHMCNWEDILRAELVNPIIRPDTNPPTITGGGPEDCSQWFVRVFKVFENHIPDKRGIYSEHESEWVKPDIKKLREINETLCHIKDEMQTEGPWYEHYPFPDSAGGKNVIQLHLGGNVIDRSGMKVAHGTQAYFFLKYNGEVLINIDYNLPDTRPWRPPSRENFTEEEREEFFETLRTNERETRLIFESMQRELNGLGIQIVKKNRGMKIR